MKKILTIILDGFGYREETEGNAIKAANMATFNGLWNEYPHALLAASEEPIGLREGQFGNSEIGHTIIGAGRIVKQSESIVDEMFENNQIDELIAERMDFIEDSFDFEPSDEYEYLEELCRSKGI